MFSSVPFWIRNLPFGANTKINCIVCLKFRGWEKWARNWGKNIELSRGNWIYQLEMKNVKVDGVVYLRKLERYLCRLDVSEKKIVSKVPKKFIKTSESTEIILKKLKTILRVSLKNSWEFMKSSWTLNKYWNNKIPEKNFSKSIKKKFSPKFRPTFFYAELKIFHRVFFASSE